MVDQKDTAKANRLRLENDIKTVMSSASGMRLLWHVISKGNTFSSIFSQDSNIMAYNAGQRDLANSIILDIVNADENLYIKLLKENRQVG